MSAQATRRGDALPIAARRFEIESFQRAADPSGEGSTASARLVLSTGAPVRRFDFLRDRAFNEVLVVDEGSIRLDRLKRGAPLLNTHDSFDLEAVLGVIDEPVIRDGKLEARAQFSRRASASGHVQDVADGIVRNVSVGYVRHRIIMEPPATDADLWTYRVVDWEVYEGSLVPIPADMDAQVMRSASDESTAVRTFPCEFDEVSTRAHARSKQDYTMNEAEQLAAQEQARIQAEEATRVAARAAAETAAAAERARIVEINEMCKRHRVEDLAGPMVNEGKTIEQARAAVLEAIAAKDIAAGGHRNVSGIRTVSDELETRASGLVQALLSRLDTSTKLDDNGRQYRGMSLIEMGRDWLEYRGVNTRGLTRMDLATKIFSHRSADEIAFRWPGETELAHRGGGMMGTSDFASLLGNVANKRLRRGYDENSPTYRVWARQAPSAPDFKAMTVVQLGAAPDLLQVNEHAEFTYGSMTDGKETYALVTSGRIVSLSRQSLINDDLRGFDRLVTAFGNSAARLENRTVYGILTANAALSDGGLLFNSTATTTAGGHANLATGAGSALGAAPNPLIAARAAMRKQKGLQAEELNIAPRFLVVPAELEQTAYQLTSPDFVPATTGNINEFRRGGRTELVPVVESLLSNSSATAWYLMADSASIDTIEFAYLEGAEGPVLESEPGFEIDGIALKARLDFAAKAIDFRGVYKSNGA